MALPVAMNSGNAAMDFATQLESAEIEKSSEVETGGISTNWRVVVALRFPLARLAMSKYRPTILLGCCAEYQKHRRAKLRTSLVTSRRYAKNYTPTAIAFNAILRNTASWLSR
jgi:hypothetical protein